MTVRVTPEAVREIIDADVGTSMNPFIAVASNLTDKVSDNDSDSVLTASDLYELERWLAAFFYAQFDPQYSGKETEGEKALFQVGLDGDKLLDINRWGRMAMLLDTTGYLSLLNARAKKGRAIASGSWLGLPPSSQTDYEDRD